MQPDWEDGGGCMKFQTEQEWLTCRACYSMLNALRGRISDRKVRLFACACCRRIWDLLDPPCRRAVAAAERYADGLAHADELEEAADAVVAAEEALPKLPGVPHLEMLLLPIAL